MSDEDPERTVYQPAPGSASAAPTPLARKRKSGPVPQSRKRSGGQVIKVGDILNHLYEVRRLIAKGGMGEVFEGCNVNYAEERVAIKVILPHLAADPAVQEMFFKEARTLTRLSHPALVQYRTLAQEPRLGVFYIVTEFVDGPNLSERLDTLNADEAQIASLTKRLAEGLSAAHSMGAIHRDISPDNILLEGGLFDKAKVIDFGIAKELDPEAKTIVGDGFAGKLNYVAPEQLGEFGRNIGPWTDIYSLGLTVLAVARRRDVDMGGSIVDAVDKRRAGPDISAIPTRLQPLFRRMLAANPADRFHSMDEVVAWLSNERARSGKIVSHRRDANAPSALARFRDRLSGLAWMDAIRQKLSGPQAPKILISGALGVLALTAIGLTFVGGSNDGQNADVPSAEKTDAINGPIGVDPVASTRRVLSDGMDGLPCTWVELSAVEGGDKGGPVKVGLTGVSGRMNDAVAQIEARLRTAGVAGVSVNYDGVSIVPQEFCSPVEVFSKFRTKGTPRLSAPQRRFEMTPLDEQWGSLKGRPAAMPIFELDRVDIDQILLAGITAKSEVSVIDVEELKRNNFLQELGGGRFRITLPTSHAGWSGLLLLTGDRPIDKKLVERPASAGPFDRAWMERIENSARGGSWKAEMIWYESVDAVPDVSTGTAPKM